MENNKKPDAENLLQVCDIYKSFGDNAVLKGMTLSLASGEVLSLIGGNGAGKSTLMKIIMGIYTHDSGKVIVNGKEMTAGKTTEALSSGVYMVPQEPLLFPNMTVEENILIGFTKPQSELHKELVDTMKKIGWNLELNRKANTLSIAEQQLVELLRGLLRHAKILILDEPTTSLNNDEVAHLFDIVNNLKKKGTSFIFISHKMPEIFRLSDRYTVFRNGEFIGAGNIKDTTPEDVTRMMVGEKYSDQDVYEKRSLGDIILELKDFSGEGFRNINLAVKKGSIVGLTGLQGAGSSELMQCMFGVTRAYSGEMRAMGKVMRDHSIHTAMKDQIAMLASNRKENSVIPDMNILENMYLSEHTLSAWKPAISKKKEIERYKKYKEMLNIKANSCEDLITSLSGGNQQKVFLARWLNTDAEILLLDNPTQGIDVGAKAEIYKLILELAKQGKTILINTLEIPEIQKVADYCAVFYNGEIIKVLEHQEIDEMTVMMYSTNAAQAEEGK